ncbi:hypothetical protein BC939DRAFT_492044 [Gamsiella multidivaricata]|uniref:uncharacterized protein n=1 Tax=Gamsiella multidivaricata TaxID=101098 RepID=UPI00221F425B|nr:uncharacterized protein BC939DRAFT_492044 [Gamsiella multidivaricata]KAI7825647.1 hypothetical protein BC939DRAFT_492044 [Gamsiella multidivaricata]
MHRSQSLVQKATRNMRNQRVKRQTNIPSPDSGVLGVMTPEQQQSLVFLRATRMEFLFAEYPWLPRDACEEIRCLSIHVNHHNMKNTHALDDIWKFALEDIDSVFHKYFPREPLPQLPQLSQAPRPQPRRQLPRPNV